jgi:retron-type reverse transcriptase
LENGYEWCVDLDLEKFFDLVCHQRLMARLAERVGDRRLLVLIGRMLKAKVVLPDGVQIASEQGVPQGGPLSPLLLTSCWSSSIASLTGVVSGSFATQTTVCPEC